MSLASAQAFLAMMKSDQGFRVAVTGFSDATELGKFLQSQGYEFALPDLIKAMGSCMAGLDQLCS